MKARKGTRPPLSPIPANLLVYIPSYRDGGAVGTWPRGPIGRGSGWNRRITAITVFTPNQESGGYSSYSLGLGLHYTK